MMKLANAACILSVFLGCTAEPDSSRVVRDAEPLRTLPQRVTATVKRETTRLLRVETEHETFVTTPEHPFASPESGWIAAERLGPGDRVVSAKSGAALVLSVQTQTPAQAVTVFNLTVDRSHAYLVGADQVLVHNTRCKDPEQSIAEATEKINAANRRIEELQSLAARSPAQDAEIAELKKRITNLKGTLRRARNRLNASNDAVPQHENAPAPSEPAARAESGASSSTAPLPRHQNAPAPNAPKEDTLTRKTRELQETERELEALKSAPNTPETQKRIADLRKQRAKIKKSIHAARSYARLKQISPLSAKNQRLLARAQADHERARKALEEAQSTLHELESQNPASPAEKAALEARKAELEKRIKSRVLDSESAKQILSWRTQLAELEKRSPSTDAERAQLKREKTELRTAITAEADRVGSRQRRRKRRADPEQRAQLNARNAQNRHQRLRTKTYLADTDRAPDPLERLEQELAAAHQEPASPTRDQRITELTDRIDTVKALTESRRKVIESEDRLYRARSRREKVRARGEDTTELDQEIAEAQRVLAANRAEVARLRAHALLLGIERERRRNAAHGIDPALLRELEREVAEGGPIDEAGLREVERMFAETVHGESDALDAEFFDEIWREAGSDAESNQEDVQAEAEDVEAALATLAESMRASPSPSRQKQGMARAQADHERAQKALEEAQSTLHELESQNPESPADKAALEARKAELENRIRKLVLDGKSAKQLLIWRRQLAELETRSPSTSAERAQLEWEKTELKKAIEAEAKRADNRQRNRKRRADPEQRAQINARNQQTRHRRLRTKTHLADTERAPDPLERLEQALAAAHQEPASAARDLRIAELTDRIDTVKGLTEFRRRINESYDRLRRARRRREKLRAQGQDTTELDQKIAGIKQMQAAHRAEVTRLRARALLLGIERARRRNAAHGIDPALLRELEREVAEGGPIDAARLREVERMFAETLHGESDALDPEFFDEIWRETGSDAESNEADVQAEAEDVEAALATLAESMWASPSPAREAAVASGLQALQDELREERNAVERAAFDLTNRWVFLSQTLAQPGSHLHTETVQRMAELQQQQANLRTQWRADMRRRLAEAQEELRVLQSLPGLRDQTTEAELARKIELLERELANEPL